MTNKKRKRCMVPTCTHTNKLRYTHFKLPVNEIVREQWLKAFRDAFPNRFVRKNVCICEKHFKKSDIISFRDFTDATGRILQQEALKLKRLKAGAVPYFEEFSVESESNEPKPSSSAVEQFHQATNKVGVTPSRSYPSRQKSTAIDATRTIFKRIALLQTKRHPTKLNPCLNEKSQHSINIKGKHEIEKEDMLSNTCEESFSTSSDTIQAAPYECGSLVEVENINVQEVDEKRVKNEVEDKQMGDIEFVNVSEEPLLCETSENLRNIAQSVLPAKDNYDHGVEIKTESEAMHALQYVKQEIVDEYDEPMNIDYRALDEGFTVKNETKCEPDMCDENQDIVKYREEGDSTPSLSVKLEVLDECGNKIETVDREDLNETDLKANNQKSKKQKGKWQCPLCSKVFKTKYGLTVHEGVHSKERPFKCNVCGKCYRLKPFLQQHVMRVHNNFPRQTCTICYSQFKGKHVLKMHMKTVHGVSDNQLVCKGTEDTEMKADDRTTTENANIEQECPEPLPPGTKQECKKCFKAFTRTYDLLRHDRLHHENDGHRFTCGTCGKVCARKSHLVQHERTHTNERPFPCDFCNMSFAQKATMVSHMARVHGQAAEPNTSDILRCPVCDKTFWKKSDFAIHERVHTDERPYLCELCGKAFRATNAIKKHMINAHDQCHKKVQCTVCGKEFKWKHKLMVHERTHTQERPYACSLCEKRFNQRVLLRMHMKKYHDAGGVLYSSQNDY